MFAKLRQVLRDLCIDGDARPRGGATFLPQFEPLENRENPATQSDVLVWGASWQEYHVSWDNHLHVQYSTNAGPVQDLDLSAAIGSTTTFVQSEAPLVATTFFGNPYVFVQAADDTIHSFYWTGSKWSEADIHNLANYSPKSTYAMQIAAHTKYGSPHVFFASGQHMHEFYWSINSGWKGIDLTVASGSIATGNVTSGVVASLATADGAERVYYSKNNGAIFELKWTSATGWTDAHIAGSPNLLNDSAREITALEVGNTRFVYYHSYSNLLIQLSSTGSAWTKADLHAAAGVTPDAVVGASIQAYYHNDRLNIAYYSAGSKLQMFQWTAADGWSTVNLSELTGAPELWAGPDGTLGGNITTLVAGNTEVVFYLGINSRMNRMFNWGDPLFGWQNVNGLLY